MSEIQNQQVKRVQELGILGEKIAKGREKKFYKAEDEEDLPQINPVTGEIDSQAIQNAQNSNQCIQVLFPGFNPKNISCGLIVLFLIIYIGIWAVNLNKVLPKTHPMYGQIQDTFVTVEMGCTLYNYGGRYTPDLYENYAFWRLFTSLIVHGDVMQLSMNIFTLLVIGHQLEVYLGKQKFILCLLFSGVLGNLFAQQLHYSLVYSGACQCIFAMYGMQAFFMYDHYSYLGSNRLQQGKQLLITILTTFFLFLMDNQIEYKALPVSLIIGFFVSYLLQKDKYNSGKGIIITILLISGYIAVNVYFLFKFKRGQDQGYPCDPWTKPQQQDND